MIGAGGQAGQSDAANLLKPALARGELRTIAATTWAEYKKYFEKDAALARRFQVVKVEEPTEDRAIRMMRGLTGMLEKHHGVRDPRRGRRERGQALAPLHPRPAAARQVGQPARHRLRPRGDRPERHPAGRRGLPPHRSSTSRSRSASSTARRATGRPPRRADRRAADRSWSRPRARLAELEARWETGSRQRRGDPRALRGRSRQRYTEEEGRRRDRRRPALPALAPSWPPCRPTSRAKTERAPQAPGRVAADAGLRRLPDHRRGRRRLDRHPRRQDARRRDPDRAQPQDQAGGARHRPVARPGGDQPADPHRRGPT